MAEASTPTPQQQPVPHYEWERHDHEDPGPDSEVDQATAALEAAKRVLADDHVAKPVDPDLATKEAAYDRIDNAGGHRTASDIRRQVGLED